MGNGDRVFREDEGLQRIAAEDLASRTGMSMSDAFATLEFQDAIMPLLTPVRRALGEASGEIWFDDDGRRVKVGLACMATPPTGPRVEAAKRILSERGLLERVDFVSVRWTIAELIAGQQRAWKLLEPLTRVTNVETWIDPSTNSVVIKTADELTAEQLASVEEAVGVAGVSVRVERTLPTPDPSLPPVAMAWRPLSVGEDLSSLLVTYFPGPHLAGETTISLHESETEIWIGIYVPDIRSFPGTMTPDVKVRRRATVDLGSAVEGRALTGPHGSPSWERTNYDETTVDGTPQKLVPRVLGLRPADARRLLIAQQLEPRIARAGRQIVSQQPPPDTPIHSGATVALSAGDEISPGP